jgi:DNA-directed RNA polymerase subunit RPC12/RpoP
MPWCQTCSRFLNPNSLKPDGSCPNCGRVVAEPKPAEPAAEAAAAKAEREKAPWHFKLLIVITIIYLTWRAIQMIGWVIN